MLIYCSVGSFNQLQLWIQYNWNMFPDFQSHVKAEGSVKLKCNDFWSEDYPSVHLMGTRNIIRFPPVPKWRKLTELTWASVYTIPLGVGEVWWMDERGSTSCCCCVHSIFWELWYSQCPMFTCVIQEAEANQSNGRKHCISGELRQGS